MDRTNDTTRRDIDPLDPDLDRENLDRAAARRDPTDDHEVGGEAMGAGAGALGGAAVGAGRRWPSRSGDRRRHRRCHGCRRG